MKVDGMLMAAELGGLAERARNIEAIGYDGLLTAETQHDPLLPPAAGGRAHRAPGAGHVHRRGLPP